MKKEYQRMKWFKKALALGTAAFGIMLLAGCATNKPLGLIRSDYTTPEIYGVAYPTSNTVKAQKIGKAEVKDILHVWATGDNSIKAAMKNGNITKINHVDYKVDSWLGIVSTFTTVVYGE